MIERHFENVADQIRDWMPRHMPYIASPPPPPPPKRSLLGVSAFTSLQHWTMRHKALTAAFVAFFGTGAVYMIYQRRAYRQKRRARRTATGARTEVVVLAGAATGQLTTALALDLERRGYIVYVVTSSQEDVVHVRNQSRVDVIPLNLDPIDVSPLLPWKGEKVTDPWDSRTVPKTRSEACRDFSPGRISPLKANRAIA